MNSRFITLSKLLNKEIRLIKFGFTNPSSLQCLPKRMAGHSHWQNVRHTKEAKDLQKSKASQLYLRAIQNAIKGGGRIKNEFFEHVGCVTVIGSTHPSLTDLDAATNLGIEIGANEVEEYTKGDETHFQFFCDPNDVGKLHTCLENDHNITPLYAEDTYMPKTCVEVPGSAQSNLQEMYDKIRENHDYVERIFDNVTFLTS